MKTKPNPKNDEVLKILCLEDSPKDAEIMRELLVDAGYKVNTDCTDKQKEYVSYLRSNRYDLILSDFKLPGFDGFKALKWAVEICPEVPFICISGTIGEEAAVELLKMGAVDYVMKDKLKKLPIAIKRALEEAKEKEARKLAEETILKERTLLRTLIDSLPVGVFVKDKEYRKTIVNPVHLNEIKGHLKYLGQDSEIDILGKTDFEVFPKEQAKKFFTEDQKVIQDGSSLLDVEGTGFNEEGKQLCLQVSKIPLRDNNNEIIGMVGVATDITERKQAELDLIATEVRYRRLFESAKDGILILDAESGTIVDVNPFLVELLGYSTEQFHGKKIWEIGFFKDVVENLDKFLELQKKEYVRYDDLPLETANGRLINVEFVSNLYLVEKKKVIQCNIRDITERKLAELALQEIRHNLSRAQKLSHLGSWDWDIVKSSLFWSDELYRIFGIDPHTELTFDKIVAQIHPDDRTRNQEFVNKILNKSDITGISLRIIRADGDIRHIYQRAEAQSDKNGKVIRIMGTMQDITDRILAEEEIKRQLKELQEWYDVSINREDRIIELKKEINSLLKAGGKSEKYEID